VASRGRGGRAWAAPSGSVQARLHGVFSQLDRHVGGLKQRRAGSNPLRPESPSGCWQQFRADALEHDRAGRGGHERRDTPRALRRAAQLVYPVARNARRVATSDRRRGFPQRRCTVILTFRLSLIGRGEREIGSRRRFVGGDAGLARRWCRHAGGIPRGRIRGAIRARAPRPARQPPASRRARPWWPRGSPRAMDIPAAFVSPPSGLPLRSNLAAGWPMHALIE
jgi:hypothetical protein